MTGSLQCRTCRRLERLEGAASTPGLACEAFPGGIPEGIIYGAIDHRRAVRGDGGLRYEANEEGRALGVPEMPFEPDDEPNEAGEYLPA